MRDQVEFSAIIQRVMKEKKLTPEKLREMLDVSAVMLHKIVCGDVVPSRHLEKQLGEILGVSPDRIKRLAGRRQSRAAAAMQREATKRKSA